MTTGFFSSSYTSGALTATQGVFRYGSGGVFPTTTRTSNYWVDVLFQDTVVADVVAPSVVSRVPTVGASGVSVASPVSVTFDEAIVAGYAVSVTPQGGSAVAGATAWDAGSRTLTFTPSAALAVSTQYAVSVSGVADAAGNAAAAAVLLVHHGGVGGAGGDDLRVVDAGGRVGVGYGGAGVGDTVHGGDRGCRDRGCGSTRVGNTGVHVGRLWDGSGALLAVVMFSGESGSGWQTAHFSSPVAVVAGQTYSVSYHAPNGGYAVTTGFFSSSYTSGALTATQGVYRYGSGGSVPDDYPGQQLLGGCAVPGHRRGGRGGSVGGVAGADGGGVRGVGGLAGVGDVRRGDRGRLRGVGDAAGRVGGGRGDGVGRGVQDVDVHPVGGAAGLHAVRGVGERGGRRGGHARAAVLVVHHGGVGGAGGDDVGSLTPAVASASDTAALELGTRFTVATAGCRDRGAVLQGALATPGCTWAGCGMAVAHCWPR